MKSKCSGKTKSGKDCKNDVSVEGETFCPTHGGETKASHEEKQKHQKNKKQNPKQNPKQNLNPKQKQNQKQNQKHTPMQKQNPLKKKTCEKICSTTKKQCKLFVSLKGEKFCPRHGGLTKSGVVMKSPRSPIPWAALHSACLNFVIVEHSLCKCEPRISPCKSMQIMIWLQQLSSLVSLKSGSGRKKSSYPSVAALRKWIEKAPLSKMNFQELLLHASRILQVQNIRWLRDLLNESRRAGKESDGEDGEGGNESGGENGIVEKNDEDGEKNVENDDENGENDGENDVEDEDCENDKNDEGENGENEGNEKGKEELNDAEMMDQSDDEVIQGVEEGELDEQEEEYVPSESAKRNVKKQKKRVKSEDDQDLNDVTFKKTMIEEFKTQNSPAI
jgi:hypothetical protein